MRAQLLRSLTMIIMAGAIGNAATAQQPADCGACNCTNFPSVLGTNLTTASAPGDCEGDPVQYTIAANTFGRFYAILGNTYTISLCGGTATDTDVYITNNVSTGQVAITCDDDGCGVPNGPSVVVFQPGITGLYRIYVRNAPCGTLLQSDIGITLTCSPSVAPANDDPCNATVLPMGTTCTMVMGTTMGATAQTIQGTGTTPLCPGALFTSGQDVWFTTTVPASGLLSIQTSEGTICAGAFSLYTATSCTGTFTQLPGTCTVTGTSGPASEPAIVFDASAAGLATGETIYIRYWERNGNEQGTFGICALEVEAPGNDEPCGAVELMVGDDCIAQTFSTEFATGLGSVTTEPASPGCGAPAGNDVWFSFTVPTPVPDGGIMVSVFNGPPEMAMAWYRLTAGDICGPGTLTEIACDHDGGGMPAVNSSALALSAGETIHVRIWSTTPWSGTFDICAETVDAPANDEPCDAILLNTGFSCEMRMFTNLAATQTGFSPPGVAGVLDPSCGGTPQADVWFTVVVPNNGTVELDMMAGDLTDAAMAVYAITSGACETNDMFLAEVACSSSGSQQGSFFMPYLQVNGQVPGSTLYVRVWTQNGSDGTFGICARNTGVPNTDCYYVVEMNDAAGDGWGGSYITICMNGVCTEHTLYGSSGQIVVPAMLGALITISYTGSGPGQLQNSFLVSNPDGVVYFSGLGPASGSHYSAEVDCTTPEEAICNNTPIQQLSTGASVSVSGSSVAALDAGGLGFPQVWQAFEIQECADITFSYCASVNAGDMSITQIYSSCPHGDVLSPVPLTSGDTTSCGNGLFTGCLRQLAEGTYYIPVPGGSPNYTLNISATACSQTEVPVNDQCGDATELFVSNECIWITATTEGATGDGEVVECGVGGGTANDDVWFKFIANNLQQGLGVQPEGDMDVVVEAMTGDCSGLQTIFCADENGAGGIEVLAMDDMVVGETYYVRVFHRAPTPACDNSFSVCVVSDFTTAVPEHGNIAWTLAPNPNNGMLTLFNPGAAADARIVITDALGRIVHAGRALVAERGAYSLDLSGRLAPGMYQVSLITGNQRVNLPMVVE